MDADRIEGNIKEFGGRAKEAAGAMFGDSSLRTEGYYDQAEGKTQATFGQVKDYVTNKPVGAIIIAGLVGFAFGLIAGRR